MLEKDYPKQILQKIIATLIVFVLFGISAWLIMNKASMLQVKHLLKRLNMNNIDNIEIYSKIKMDGSTRKNQGYTYKLKFDNLKDNTTCKGTIIRDLQLQVSQNLTCINR
jgi:hypothetical protein